MNPNIARSFEILGTDVNATFEQARRAYHLKMSGDLSWDEIKQLNAAWEILQAHFSVKPPQTGPAPGNGILLEPSSTATPRARKASHGKPIVISAIVAGVIAFALLGIAFVMLKASRPVEFSEIVRKAKPSIVTILLDNVPQGSGFLVSDDGYIVTSAQVMHDTSGTATFPDGTSVGIDLVFIDPDRDFALIRSRTPRQYPFLKLGDSVRCAQGDLVITAGNPPSFEPTFTRGTITSLRKKSPLYSSTFLQTDVAVSPGNSGGPLIDSRGNVIGINSPRISGQSFANVGFAVSISDVKGEIAARQHMTYDELLLQITRLHKKMESINAWLDMSPERMKDRAAQEQWVLKLKHRDYKERVIEGDKRFTEETERLQQMIRERSERRKQAFSECLETAWTNYESGWNDTCKSLYMDVKCVLPSSRARILERSYHDAQKECFQTYGRPEKHGSPSLDEGRHRVSLRFEQDISPMNL